VIRKHDYSDLITVIVVNNLCNHKMQVFNAFYIGKDISVNNQN